MVPCSSLFVTLAGLNSLVTIVYRVDLSRAQPLDLQVVCTSAVKYDSGMCRPDSQMTLGSSMVSHSKYYLCLSRKCSNQFTKFLSEPGANLSQFGGTKPLNMQLARSSSSYDIPISPTNARFKSFSEFLIKIRSTLKRSSSWSSTTWVGAGTSNFFLMLKMSNSSGSFS